MGMRLRPSSVNSDGRNSSPDYAGFALDQHRLALPEPAVDERVHQALASLALIKILRACSVPKFKGVGRMSG